MNRKYFYQINFNHVFKLDVVKKYEKSMKHTLVQINSIELPMFILRNKKNT